MRGYKYVCVNLKVVFPARKYSVPPISINGIAKSPDLSIQNRSAKRNVIVYSHPVKHRLAYISTGNSSYPVVSHRVYHNVFAQMHALKILCPL